jgi:hypothetical protein
MARNNTSGWRELNDLVLREFESLERAGRSLPEELDRSPPADRGVVFLTQRGEADTTQAPARPAADEMLAEETNLEEESAGEEEPAGREHAPIFQSGEAGPGQVMELFKAEEAAFIARSVAWLQGKPSKDMILSQIWVQLQESEPDGFFTTAQEPIEPGEEETLPSDPPCSSPPQEP